MSVPSEGCFISEYVRVSFSGSEAVRVIGRGVFSFVESNWLFTVGAELELTVDKEDDVEKGR